ncbi:TIGR01212 family radical SAM protein [Tissierella praeacuta]|uniref:TIGR01212 family radical SAM protein n=1 Tax=Tissierella praeacuta TaxID=43131 RepID=UPI003341B072
MNQITVYNTYSKYLNDKYGEKVYKLPINLPLTCPNRDGTVGRGGCIFCGEEGGSFENLSSSISIKEQLEINKEYIGRRYKAKKFIAYFQNFTNTYLPFEKFKDCIEEALVDDIVGISISTRPDCVNDRYLEYLSKVKEDYNIDIIIELGLQTVNYHTLKKINRGHTLAEYIDASIKIKKYGLRNCSHIILNLPWDDDADVIENAKILSSLGIEEVKLHALYIVDGTALGNLYKKGEIFLISKEEYMERVILFLEYLDPNIVIQRIIGRAPEENLLFVNWNESWWKIRDEIVSIMELRNSTQGIKFNYLNGKGIKKFE